jgi:hypothetical protein
VHGARTPLLALNGLRRLPNLVLVVAPYAVTVPLALALSDRLGPAVGAGLVAWSIAPGALLGPRVVSAAGGRRADMAGALGLGTVLLSLVLVATRPGQMTLALTAFQSFLIASLVAGALPTVRDRVLAPLRWAGDAAAVAVVVLAAASLPPIDAVTVAVAIGALAVSVGVAGLVARALGRDLPSALAAGTRDPILAAALAWSTAGAEATGVPLVNAVILGIVAGALIIRRR